MKHFNLGNGRSPCGAKPEKGGTTRQESEVQCSACLEWLSRPVSKRFSPTTVPLAQYLRDNDT